MFRIGILLASLAKVSPKLYYRFLRIMIPISRYMEGVNPFRVSLPLQKEYALITEIVLLISWK